MRQEPVLRGVSAVMVGQARWRPVAAAILFSVTLIAGFPKALCGQTPPRPVDLPDAISLFPDADRIGAPEGVPRAVQVFRGDELLGYAFHSYEAVASTGFSGRPIDVLIGIGVDARIADLQLVEQHEPILAIGIDESELAVFIRQYKGLDLRHPVRLTTGARSTASGRLDGISGASISSIVLNDAIMRSARDVARSRGLMGVSAKDPGLDGSGAEKANWSALLRDGSIARRYVTVGAIRAFLPDFDPAAEPTATFIDLYAALVTPDRIGRTILGDRRYAQTMAQLRDNEPVLFIAGSGLYSFKGTAFTRTGVFDRISVSQGERSFHLRREDYQRIDQMQADGAPELTEAGLFRLPAGSGFDPNQPWRLDVLVVGPGQGGDMARVTLDYHLPDRYLATSGPTAEAPLWRQVWQQRQATIATLITALVALLTIFLLQDWLVRRPRLYRAIRVAFLAFTLLWLGYWSGAQLSVLHVLTFLHALMAGFRWDYFLVDPLMFLLWSFVAIAMLFWGRAVFCGWLCPFGALQEFTSTLARYLGFSQLRVPFLLHERLWPIKYVIFVGLLALSLQSLELAEPWVEVEPFKTAIVLKFARSSIYVLYAVSLLAGSFFVERLFCRYLCPLGGALALPARLRMFDWLKRRRQCGTECQICAQRCPVQAIHPTGQINPNECIDCLGCQVLYYDDRVCPPLIERRKRREGRAGNREVTSTELDGPTAVGP